MFVSKRKSSYNCASHIKFILKNVIISKMKIFIFIFYTEIDWTLNSILSTLTIEFFNFKIQFFGSNWSNCFFIRTLKLNIGIYN